MVNCVLINIHNPFWTELCIKAVEFFSDYINIEACSENKMYRLYEDEPHVTLCYNETIPLGKNMIDFFITIKCRDLYEQLKSNNLKLKVDEFKLNLFESDRGKVLKLDLNNCDKYEVLKSYHERIEDLVTIPSDYPDYNPHVTITYLTKEVTQDLVDEFMKTLDHSKYLEYDLVQLAYSEGKGEGRKVRDL